MSPISSSYKDVITHLKERRDNLDRLIGELSQQLHGIEGFESNDGGESDDETLSSYIRAIIGKSGSRGVNTGEIYDALDRYVDSFRPPSVRSILAAWKKKGIVKHLEDGRYRMSGTASTGDNPVPGSRLAEALAAARNSAAHERRATLDRRVATAQADHAARMAKGNLGR